MLLQIQEERLLLYLSERLPQNSILKITGHSAFTILATQSTIILWCLPKFYDIFTWIRFIWFIHHFYFFLWNLFMYNRKSSVLKKQIKCKINQILYYEWVHWNTFIVSLVYENQRMKSLKEMLNFKKPKCNGYC